MAKKSSWKKTYGKAAQRLKVAAMTHTSSEAAERAEVEAAAALFEGLYVQGFTAVLDGELSFEAVTAAVQAALSMSQPGCTNVATFLGTCVYEHGGKLYQVTYSIKGTEVLIDSEPEEVAAEFAPVGRALGENREAPLIEARPAGTIKHDQLNRALNVIENTVLITANSVNGAGKGGRRYSDDALRKIATMAEGLPAYVNHVAPDQAFKPRDVKDLIGVHRNVRYFPSEGRVMSDLHVVEHQAPLVFGLAEKLGNVIGNSLVSRGLVQMEGETEVVKDIVSLRSADIVSDPATTKGLFESRDGITDPFGTLIMELREALKTPKEEHMDFAAILTFLKDKPDQQALLAESLGFAAKPAVLKLQESVTSLTTERDDLSKQVTALEAEKTKVAADLKESSAKLDEYTAKDALIEKRAKIATAIENHDLGKQFGKIKEVVSDKFKALLESQDEAEWSKELDDRFASLKGVSSSNGTPRSERKSDDLTESKKVVTALPDGIEARFAAAL